MGEVEGKTSPVVSDAKRGKNAGTQHQVCRERVGEDCDVTAWALTANSFKVRSAWRLLSDSASFNLSASLRFDASCCNISSRSLTASRDLDTSKLAWASCSVSLNEVETASADVRRRDAISCRICSNISSLSWSKAEKGGSEKIGAGLVGTNAGGKERRRR